jgi:hypothetical protein
MADIQTSFPVNVTNFPSTQPVSIVNFPSTTLDSISVINFPSVQVVSVTNFPLSETEIGTVNYYSNVTNIAALASGTITYTVTSGKKLYLKQVIASSSGGPCKVVVITGTGGSAVTQAVVFYSAATLSVVIPFAQPIVVLDVVNVQIWNLAGATMDVYGTINGKESV